MIHSGAEVRRVPRVFTMRWVSSWVLVYFSIHLLDRQFAFVATVLSSWGLIMNEMTVTNASNILHNFIIELCLDMQYLPPVRCSVIQ
jgi:hypothetical protein